jgi:molybdenum cofactor biosynthesis enzyme MoaA
MTLVDAHGRTISYLRLSVTDRCNLRCGYCMPADGVAKTTHADILRFEELEQIAEIAVSLGVEKVRITGGEPLVRKGLVPFLARLSAIPGLNFLVLTTNGLLLAEMAAGWSGSMSVSILSDPKLSAPSREAGIWPRFCGGSTLPYRSGCPIPSSTWWS